MAFPSITNTFVNGSSAEAGEVNTNFTDIVNGFSDGTKSLNMDEGTFAGAVVMNGDVTLGNGTGDDLTFTGSLASTLNIKTDGVYDVGSSTLGLQAVYFGDGGGNTVNIQAPAIAANFTFTLPAYTFSFPTTDGSDGHALFTNGDGTSSFETTARDPSDLHNYSFTVAMAASAVTVALKGKDGNDPSATNRVEMNFRSETLTDGDFDTIGVTSALSAIIDSGATLGTADGVGARIYIYAINNSGTIELAVSKGIFSENGVHTTTALSSGADSGNLLYSETLRSNVPIRLIGSFVSSQATAGTWATNPSEIYVGNSPLAIDRDNSHTITTTYTVLEQDSLVLLSSTGGAYTTTLFSADGLDGKRLTFQKTTSDYSAITLDGSGSETIGGDTTTTINTLGETLVLEAFQGNWLIISRYIPTNLTDQGALTIGAGASPTKGTTTIDRWVDWREGRFLFFKYEYIQTGAGSNGSGDYALTIPNSLAIDTDFQNTGSAPVDSTCGSSKFNVAGADYLGTCYALNTTAIRCEGLNETAASTIWGSSFGALGNSTLKVMLIGRVPISGWKG